MPINYQALFDMSMSPDEGMRALAATAAKKLTPAEIQEFSQFQHQLHAGMDPEQHRQDNSFLGVPPELAAAGAAAGVAKGIPAVAGAIKDSGIVQGAMNASKGIPAAVKGGAMSYLGWEGANKVGDWLGLPAPLKTMLGLAGAHFAGGVGGGSAASEEAGVPKATPPMSDAEFAATAGRQRGEPMVGRPKTDPPNLERVPKATETSGGAFGRSVGGGVQNDFKGPVSIQRPGAKEAKFSETNDGADQLGQLLDATHGADHASMPNGGPGAKAPLTKPDVTRKSGTGSSHGPTDEYFNGRKYDIGTSGDAQTAAARSKGRGMRDWAAKKANQTDESMGHSEASKADGGRTRDAYNTDDAQMQKIRDLLKSMGI